MHRQLLPAGAECFKVCSTRWRCNQRKHNKMTSPAISKSPEKQKSDNKSPSHSSNAEQASNDEPTATTSNPQQSDPFSWFRIFKLADLMMKQGC
ncbi:unnamed protein product, partial [Brenthis ino]